jgi:hypothetical protein
MMPEFKSYSPDVEVLVDIIEAFIAGFPTEIKNVGQIPSQQTTGLEDVWVGALATSVLLTIGKFIITMYFAHTAIGSLYGAAGSLIIVLVWVYYNAHVLFFGAELACAYFRLFRPSSREALQSEILAGSSADTRLKSTVSDETVTKGNPLKSSRTGGRMK